MILLTVWLKSLIGSVSDLVSFNLFNTTGPHLVLHWWRTNDCNRSPRAHSASAATVSPRLSGYPNLNPMSVSLQLGLVQEMKTAGLLSDPIISQVPRVLLTVGGRGADQKNNLFSNFLNGELKNKPPSQPLMLGLFTGSTSFLSLAAPSEEMGDCFLLSLFLPSFPSQKWALCVYRSPTLYFLVPLGRA